MAMTLAKLWRKLAEQRARGHHDEGLAPLTDCECLNCIAYSHELEILTARIQQRNVEEWADTRELWTLPTHVESVDRVGRTLVMVVLCTDGETWTYELDADDVYRR